MRTLPRRSLAAASILTATLALASASATSASAEIPTGVDVLFARAYSDSVATWWGTPAEPGSLQVQVGFRVHHPTLTLRDGTFYELPGAGATALPAGGPVRGSAELDCAVVAPGTLNSLTPEYADVHCYGSVNPADGATGEGRFIAVTPTASGTRSFGVDWERVTYTPR